MMWKRRFIALFVGLALTVAVTGITTMVADTLGYSVTPQAQAGCGAGGGGGC
jgi:hypothetical protein